MVIALPVDEGQYVYPTWQFANGAFIFGLDVTLAALNTEDPWAQAAFLLNCTERGQSPLDLLQRGDVAGAVKEATFLSAQGDAWLRILPGTR